MTKSIGGTSLEEGKAYPKDPAILETPRIATHCGHTAMDCGQSNSLQADSAVSEDAVFFVCGEQQQIRKDNTTLWP